MKIGVVEYDDGAHLVGDIDRWLLGFVPHPNLRQEKG